MTHPSDKQLNEYLDQALDVSARREIDGHLRSCADCRARLGELQLVFTTLAGLPEAHLARDLTAKVLARLPEKQSRAWTPVFAAQLGAALGAFLWLSVQAVKFVLPALSALRLPQLALPAISLPPAASNFPMWGPNLLRFWATNFRFTLPNFAFAVPQLHLPNVDLPISTFELTLIAVSVFMLWLVGNAALLRGRSEAKG